jgi:hypothetical protein
MYAGGGAVTTTLPTTLPTTVYAGHSGLRLVWCAGLGPGIPWRQPWGGSTRRTISNRDVAGLVELVAVLAA